MKLMIAPYSDDVVTYEYDGDGAVDLNTGHARFVITLPGGDTMRADVEYADRGWQFTIDLPDGVDVEAVANP